MTTEQKVESVTSARDTYGLTLALAVVDLPKSTLRLRSAQALVLPSASEDIAC
jgi:hypothetical protein